VIFWANVGIENADIKDKKSTCLKRLNVFLKAFFFVDETKVNIAHYINQIY
jgi:hypothetical protein